MSAIKVNLEIGHEASMKSMETPKGFTHDWKVYVRGQEGADISHFVDKVVFHLHETFPKPRRVVKDPPFTIKEAGYAGFFFPIDIYLKNKDEPKKIKFTYDLTLEESGFLRDRYIFQNPNDEFKRKLLKGGGIPISNSAYYTNPDQKSRESFVDDKIQLVSKTKLSSEHNKKHKTKEYKDGNPLKASSFETLFGAPIQKPPKVSPELKTMQKFTQTIKSEKKENDRSSSEKMSRYEHKESKPDKTKIKEERDKQKVEKIKNHRISIASKRSGEKQSSPAPSKKKCLSPNYKVPSPAPRSSSALSIKEEYKPQKHSLVNYEQKKTKVENRSPDIKLGKELKEKKKIVKSHDIEKEKREKKEHKKDSHKSKKSEMQKEIVKELPKSKEVIKEKDSKGSPMKEKQLKIEKPINKISEEIPEPITISKKYKDKSSKKEEKRRKRKAEAEEIENRKVAKPSNSGPVNSETDCGESSASTSMEIKVQDNGASILGEDAEPGELLVQLRGLQQRIMMINNNEDLERVVNLIAETGRYEVTTQTFDFDLFSLDRSTVQQLIRLVGC